MLVPVGERDTAVVEIPPPHLGPRNAGRILGAYAERADSYDYVTELYHGWRRELVDLLPLRRGDVVLDAGCGTGLCFPMLERKIGAEGGIVGVDEAPDMLAIARRRVARNGWRNVTLVQGAMESAPIPVPADAALFCAVHDILRSPAALRNAVDHLRPGAWVAAGGGKWASPWLVPLNLSVRAIHGPFIRDFAGFDRPWRLLEPLLEDFRVTEVAIGSGFLAVGRLRCGAGSSHVADVRTNRSRPPLRVVGGAEPDLG